ncbi:hypothetical protein BAMY_05865 [Bacillus amyloliquefaciens]|uniref:Uncharacterized protein n=1 Tax=Bacillus velezensis TaxID=492670 RepID=A0A6A8LGT1_BACVE|nr:MULTISPECIES: hypothetical protein [Bacillus]ALV00915.1 hypothetical protein AVM03_00510 [Bacillus amyloliquefaciens]APB81656.1 hypothetical protein BAMY_05865 [Bacillus amyloliquefaciens]AVX17838.1 hypothetical protein C5I45_13560 [Bacillus sp. ZY-1-1]AWM82642.1 hypothetical protein B7L90_05030 [Bacillus velezensis]KDN89559.1 hypothetical protein EF87_21375 [Bacillus amyloliquefaciens]
MKILKFKFDDSFFELHAAFKVNLDIQTDYDIQKDMLMMSKAILKTAGYTKFLTQDTYIRYEESNSVYCHYSFEETK